MFPLALSPIRASSFCLVVVLQCNKSCFWLSFQLLQWKGDIYSVLLLFQWLTRPKLEILQGPPSLSSTLTINQSLWNIYVLYTLSFTFPSLGPNLRVISSPSRQGSPLFIVMSIFVWWSPAEAGVWLLFLYKLICICQDVCVEMACCGCLVSLFLILLLPLSLSVFFNYFFSFFFFFLRRKGFLIPSMPERGPLRITLAKPLSLQEIQCLL